VAARAIEVSVYDRMDADDKQRKIRALIKAAHDYMDKGLDDDGTGDADADASWPASRASL
jgi:hypothetical protein